MATLLYRIGALAAKRHFVMIGVWILVLIAAIFGSKVFDGQMQQSVEIPGTESQTAIDMLQTRFPQASGAGAKVIFVAPKGQNITDFEGTIEPIVGELKALDHVVLVGDPFSADSSNQIAADKSMAYVSVQYDVPQTSLTAEDEEKITSIGNSAESAGLTVAFAGVVSPPAEADMSQEAIGLILAFVILAITFGSLLAAGMPLITALVAVGISTSGISIFAAFVTISSTAPILASMLGLAVGIDYALFIVSRHRAQLAEGMEPKESIARATATAGSAVVFAGLTVIIALMGLAVVQIPFLTVMGFGAAFGVVIAILVSVTLLPAVLGLFGRLLIPRSVRKQQALAARAAKDDADQSAAPDSESADATQDAPELAGVAITAAGDMTAAGRTADPERDAEQPTPVAGKGKRRKRTGHPFRVRWVTMVSKHAVVTVVVTVIGLLTLAAPALGLRLTVPDAGYDPPGSQARVAYELLSQGFGPGFNGPLLVAADISSTLKIQEALSALESEFVGVEGVADVSKAAPNQALDMAIISITPSSSPDSDATTALVHTIREMEPAFQKANGFGYMVTGQTAIAIDISGRLGEALLPFGLVVVGLCLVLLMMVFRSLAVPITATLGFLLSVVATFGVVTAVFNWGWLAGPLGVEKVGPVISFMPILVMAVLFGLAMDYQVFLVTRMREDFALTHDARRSVIDGFSASARVVTAAALIMVSVFASFVPGGGAVLQPLAGGLAVGVLIDAFIVRMTLIPALMALLGDHAWYLPRWLQRVIPNVDLEGEKVQELLDAKAWHGDDTAAAIQSDDLVINGLAPVDLGVDRGHLLIVAAEHPVDSRAVLAVLSGHAQAESGHLTVLGHSLPFEAARLRRRSDLILPKPAAQLPRFSRPATSAEVRAALRDGIALGSQLGNRSDRLRSAETVFAELSAALGGTIDQPVEFGLLIDVAVALGCERHLVAVDLTDIELESGPHAVDTIVAALTALTRPVTTIVVAVSAPAVSRLSDRTDASGRYPDVVVLQPGGAARSTFTSLSSSQKEAQK